MKFSFICPQVPGHLNPMTTLARHLQMRNHDVTFLYSSGAADLPFIPDEEVERVSVGAVRKLVRSRERSR